MTETLYKFSIPLLRQGIGIDNSVVSTQIKSLYDSEGKVKIASGKCEQVERSHDDIRKANENRRLSR